MWTNSVHKCIIGIAYFVSSSHSPATHASGSCSCIETYLLVVGKVLVYRSHSVLGWCESLQTWMLSPATSQPPPLPGAPSLVASLVQLRSHERSINPAEHCHIPHLRAIFVDWWSHDLLSCIMISKEKMRLLR